MPIPSGSWTITAGSLFGTLTFAGTTGTLSGTIAGQPFVGFFDETSQTLTMLGNPQVGTTTRDKDVLVTPLTIYRGTLFTFTPSGTSTPMSVLAGEFYSAAGTNTAVYTTWFAQNPQPVKTAKEGKDGGKDGKDHKDKDKDKDKDAKEHGKELEKVLEKAAEMAPASMSGVGGAFGPAHSAQAAEAGSAIGQSFIEAVERPAVGEAALQAAQNA